MMTLVGHCGPPDFIGLFLTVDCLGHYHPIALKPSKVILKPILLVVLRDEGATRQADDDGQNGESALHKWPNSEFSE